MDSYGLGQSLLVKDVMKAYPGEWTELLVVVEFLIYTTPGPHHLSPRDIDRSWSLAIPLEKDLMPFQVLDFEPISEYAKSLFKRYRELRALVLEKQAAASQKRADLANRFRRSRRLEEGDMVVYRDPRARSAGGRTPWRTGMSEPCIVDSVQGNHAVLKRADGSTFEAHLEDIILVPSGAKDLEKESREDLVLDEDQPGSRRSPGQMIEDAGKPPVAPAAGRKAASAGRLAKLSPGQCVAYSGGAPGRKIRIGKVLTITRSDTTKKRFGPENNKKILK